MSGKFPHLSDTKFPNLQNVNVWEYQNNFDYEKFNDVQMHIKVCSVPWDLGEVHVGLRSIPMGNVVGWETEEQRDEYINALDGVEWDTNYRSYHDGDSIRLDIPYEYMTYFNYLIIDYSEPIVSRPDTKPIKRWLYFIRDLKQISLSTTQCEIKRDSWSMFINDVSISHMVMERGHYAMAKSADVDTYLKHPSTKTDYLLTPDVSYGTPSISTQVGQFNAQGEECYYVIACNGSPTSTLWGDYQTDGWRIVAQPNGNIEQNHPSYSIFAIDYENFGTFWDNMTSEVPQFLNTIKCVYLMSKTIVEVQNEFEFCSVPCYRLMAKNGFVDIGTFNKQSFGYGKYAEITKLYTSPYCYLEITDGEGNDVRVNIEDCHNNTVELCNYISIAYPYMSIKSYLTSVGDTRTNDVSYYALSQRNFTTRGQWWRYFWNHKIPTFAIVEGSKTHSEYSGWYSRLSAKTQTEDSADVSAKTTKRMSKAQVDTTKASGNAAISNTATQNAANSSVTAAANSQVTANEGQDKYLNNAQMVHNTGTTKDLANAQAKADIQSATIATSAANQIAGNNASASMASAGISAAAGVASGAASGALSGGAVGAGAGAISGLIGGIAGIASAGVNAATTVTNAAIQAGSTIATTNVAANLTEVQANITASNDTLNATSADNVIGAKANAQRSYNSTVTNTNNSAASAITAQTVSTQNSNAETMQDASNSNADDIKDLSYKNVATSNKYSTREMWMNAPIEHGAFENGEYQVVKPIGIWCELVTQPSDCIAQAGIEMMRYGYAYDGVVDFETFNVMSRFSYWKCKDIWMVAKNLPDAFVDEIRNYLLEGVTVWANPEFIGNTSVFENVRV